MATQIAHNLPNRLLISADAGVFVSLLRTRKHDTAKRNSYNRAKSIGERIGLTASQYQAFEAGHVRVTFKQLKRVLKIIGTTPVAFARFTKEQRQQQASQKQAG
jgi:transcriptional regulator with XRE-family HTH domain